MRCEVVVVPRTVNLRGAEQRVSAQTETPSLSTVEVWDGKLEYYLGIGMETKQKVEVEASDEHKRAGGNTLAVFVSLVSL